jgi:hypothetical protein
MGVRVVPATSPLGDDAAGKMKVIGGLPGVKVKPTRYEAALEKDAAPFDSLPGAGFDTDPASAAIVPPEGRITGSGPVLVVDPAENNAFKALNLAWRQGGSVQASAGPSGRTDSVRDPRAVGERAGRHGEIARAAGGAHRFGAGPRHPSAAGRLYQPWNGSMGEGWTRWILEQYGFAFVAVHPEDFKSPLSAKIDVLIIADDARVPISPEARGAGRGGAEQGRGGTGAARPTPRPEYAYQLTASDLQNFDRFVRGGGTVVCLSNASAFAIEQLGLPVRNVVSG